MAEQNVALGEGRTESADMETLTNALIPLGRALVELGEDCRTPL